MESRVCYQRAVQSDLNDLGRSRVLAGILDNSACDVDEGRANLAGVAGLRLTKPQYTMGTRTSKCIG